MNETLNISNSNIITLEYIINNKVYRMIIPFNCPINEFFQAINAFNAQGNKWLEEILAQKAGSQPLPVSDAELIERNPDCDIDKSEDCDSCQ